MSETSVAVPQAVMERVHAELCRSILETPDYVQKVVAELLKEPKPDSYGYRDTDPDKSKPLFERILRRELRDMIDKSMRKALLETYQPVVDAAVSAAMNDHQKLEGSLAYAFAKVLQEDWKVRIDTTFKIESERDA